MLMLDSQLSFLVFISLFFYHFSQIIKIFLLLKALFLDLVNLFCLFLIIEDFRDWQAYGCEFYFGFAKLSANFKRKILFIFFD